MAATEIDQIAASLPIHFVQGDTLRRTLHFFRNDASPSSIDISSWTITAQIRRRAASATAVSFAIDMSDAVNGNVMISITPADAATLALSNVWDLQRVVNGDVRTLLGGVVTVDREVTRG